VRRQCGKSRSSAGPREAEVDWQGIGENIDGFDFSLDAGETRRVTHCKRRVKKSLRKNIILGK
jgi:hypothetical protein